MDPGVSGGIGERSGSPENFARELILKLALKGDERVLHLGSGDGKLTAAIAACLPRGSVLGIDPSEMMIQSARDAYPSNRYNNISFLGDDIDRIDGEGAFTRIVSLDMMNWMCDPDRFYAAAARLLAPGGRLLLQMEGSGPTEAILSRIEALIRIHPWNEYFDGYTLPYTLPSPEEMMQSCEDAGLYTLRLDHLSRSLIFNEEDSLARWIVVFWYHLIERVPKDQQSLFTKAITSEYTLLYPPSPAGRISVPVHRIEIEARKDPGEI